MGVGVGVCPGFVPANMSVAPCDKPPGDSLNKNLMALNPLCSSVVTAELALYLNHRMATQQVMDLLSGTLLTVPSSCLSAACLPDRFCSVVALRQVRHEHLSKALKDRVAGRLRTRRFTFSVGKSTPRGLE